MAAVARHARYRDASLGQKVVHLLVESLSCHWEIPGAAASACRAAAQIVSMSCGERRASGCSRVQGRPGILPSDASWHDASSSVRCVSGGYAAHSEKLTALRPSATALAISHDTGAISVYHGHAVRFE